MGKIFVRSVTPKRMVYTKTYGPIWPEIKLVWDFMTVFLTYKFYDQKMKVLSSEQQFLNYKSMRKKNVSLNRE